MSKTLTEKGFRFTYRPDGFGAHPGKFDWVHWLEAKPGDVDVTDLSDDDFERYVEAVSGVQQ